MNIDKYLPYWHKGRRFINRFEINASKQLEAWQHPDQQGLAVRRPDGHEILRVIESQMLHRTIGLVTLLHFQKHQDQRPSIFRDIDMVGLLDVVYGPYGDRLFVPTLRSTPSGTTIHWMDLNTVFNCLDYIPLRSKI